MGYINHHLLSRRQALAGLGATAAALVGCGSPRPPRRPNILVAIADDWSWPHAGVGGYDAVSTPVFDRIASEGVLFQNAFATAPSCTPSRAAVLTGRYHWELEQGANLWGTLPAKFDVYPTVLEKQGYHVGFSRKGWGPGKIGAGGRERNPAGKRYRNFGLFLRARPKGAPFCFWFGSRDPHRMYGPRARLNRSLDCGDATLPACLPESRAVRGDLCNYLFEVQRFDRDLGRVLGELESVGELHNTIIVVTSDNGMPFPRCKANLYDTGTHVPLAMCWGSRWGKGRRIDQFVSLCDIAPTLLDLVGVPVPPEMSGRSLAPLLHAHETGSALSWRNHVLTGRERHICAQANTLKGYPSRAIRTSDFLYIKNFEPDRWPVGTPPAYRDVDRSPTRRYMLHHRDEPGVRELFELAFAKRPAEELYDLRSDPGQLVNVADVPRYADTRNRLATRLMNRLKRTGDPRAFGRGDVFDTYAYYMIKRIHQ